MNVRVWKGYHGGELEHLIAESWDRGELLVLCPPLLQDFSFLSALPDCGLEIAGTWTDSERDLLGKIRRQRLELPFKPALGVFTSGTLSSSPRLVLYSKENVLASLEAIYGLFDRSRIKHVFCYPQAFHCFGLLLGYVASHVNGWKLHTPHGKYQRSSHEERLALTMPDLLTLGTPTHLFDLMTHVRENHAQIAESYSCIMGGAGVSRELWLRVRDGLRIQAPSIGYGCTEASPGISHLSPGIEPRRDDEIGTPLKSVRSSITREGVTIDGPGLCSAVIQNGGVEYPVRLTIRDRVETLEDGHWVYRGRLDLTLNRGGHKYSLEEIEKLLHDRLSLGVVATAVRDSRLGEDLGLAIVSPIEGRERIFTQAALVLMETYGLRLTRPRDVYDRFPVE
jgi:acyl-CoA synthetase (AMP-forming)/AMP-acid ligase II